MCCFHYGGLSGGIIDRITKKTGNHDDEATAGSWETILNPTGAGNNTDVATNDYEYDDTLNNDDDNEVDDYEYTSLVEWDLGEDEDEDEDDDYNFEAPTQRRTTVIINPQYKHAYIYNYNISISQCLFILPF